MTLIQVIALVAVICLIGWLLNRYVATTPAAKMILTVVVVVIICILVLSVVGLANLRIG